MTTETGEAAISLDTLPFTRADIEQTVPVRFEQVACRFPNHTALVGSGQHWTYLDLNRRVNRIACAIKAFTEPGVGCVAFLLEHSPEMVIATLAVLKAGKVYLAIHPRTPASAQREIVRDAAPELMLTTAHWHRGPMRERPAFATFFGSKISTSAIRKQTQTACPSRMTLRRSSIPREQPASRRGW